MSGAKKPPDDDDLFGDDFILEDVTAPKLQDVFSDGHPQAPKGDPKGEGEDDALFHDHTKGIHTSMQFPGKPQFSEAEKADWQGEELTPEDMGIPIDADSGTGMRRGPPPADGSLLPGESGEEEFAIDQTQELEIVRDENEEPVGATEEEETFALDDGEVWQPNEQETLGEIADSEAPVETFASTGGEEELPVEEGWEPLDEAAAAEEAEAQQSVAADVQEKEEEADAAVAAAAEQAWSTVQGKQIGAPQGGRRVLRLLTSLAAAVLLLGAGAVVVAKPEWFGLAVSSDLVERVQVARPEISLKVEKPPMPPIARPADPTPRPVNTDPRPQPGNTDPQPPPVQTDPTPQPGNVDPTPVQTVPTPPVHTDPMEPTPPRPPTDGKPVHEPLLPVGENMWVGPFESRQPAEVVAAVAIGSKAFAQLKNGNFFVGSVKSVGKDALTLRLEHGEVTLMMPEIVKLASLGSADYEALLATKSGSVQLTNNNRLTGTILESIADDYVILEMRSNRVVLPRSAIGKIHDTGSDSSVRFGATEAEEEAWLKKLAARQITDEIEEKEQRRQAQKREAEAKRQAAPAPDGSTPPK